MESCPSGRRSMIGNHVYGNHYTEGSNPSLSASGESPQTIHALRFSGCVSFFARETASDYSNIIFKFDNLLPFYLLAGFTFTYYSNPTQKQALLSAVATGLLRILFFLFIYYEFQPVIFCIFICGRIFTAIN